MIHPDIIIDVSIDFSVDRIGLFFNYFQQHTVDAFLKLLCRVLY